MSYDVKLCSLNLQVQPTIKVQQWVQTFQCINLVFSFKKNAQLSDVAFVYPHSEQPSGDVAPVLGIILQFDNKLSLLNIV